MLAIALFRCEAHFSFKMVFSETNLEISDPIGLHKVLLLHEFFGVKKIMMGALQS